MHIDISDTFAMKLVTGNEAKHLVTVGNRGPGQAAQQFQDRCSIAQAAARDLTENERMHDYAAAIARVGERGVTTVQMVDPHRRVCQDQSLISGRLRGATFKAV